MYFNPQGSREPRPGGRGANRKRNINFNPQGSREPRLILSSVAATVDVISIHKALASLDGGLSNSSPFYYYFNPQGSREPRPTFAQLERENIKISIHKALASLDFTFAIDSFARLYFNPQGSREPRLLMWQTIGIHWLFQSTRLSRASTRYDRY